MKKRKWICILCGKEIKDGEEKVSTYDRYNTKEPYVHAECHMKFLEYIIKLHERKKEASE